MTFKEFMAWCNDQACAGTWNLREVMVVVAIVEDVRKKLPWRQEKYWKKRYESRVTQQIVMPINKSKVIREYVVGYPCGNDGAILLDLCPECSDQLMEFMKNSNAILADDALPKKEV